MNLPKPSVVALVLPVFLLVLGCSEDDPQAPPTDHIPFGVGASAGWESRAPASEDGTLRLNRVSIFTNDGEYRIDISATGELGTIAQSFPATEQEYLELWGAIDAVRATRGYNNDGCEPASDESWEAVTTHQGDALGNIYIQGCEDEPTVAFRALVRELADAYLH